MKWYLAVLRKYVVFTGRARRTDYWMFVLISGMVEIGLSFINGWMGGDTPALPLLYGSVVLLPSLAVSIRRLHDIDRSGWWVLLVFVPFLGLVVLLVFMATPGSEMANRFGPSPKFLDRGQTAGR